MKQRLVFPRQKVGLVWVGKPVRCSGQESCSNWGAIYRSQILLHCFLVFTFLLSPIAARLGDYNKAIKLAESKVAQLAVLPY